MMQQRALLLQQQQQPIATRNCIMELQLISQLARINVIIYPFPPCLGDYHSYKMMNQGMMMVCVIVGLQGEVKSCLQMGMQVMDIHIVMDVIRGRQFLL